MTDNADSIVIVSRKKRSWRNLHSHSETISLCQSLVRSIDRRPRNSSLRARDRTPRTSTLHHGSRQLRRTQRASARDVAALVRNSNPHQSPFLGGTSPLAGSDQREHPGTKRQQKSHAVPRLRGVLVQFRHLQKFAVDLPKLTPQDIDR